MQEDAPEDINAYRSANLRKEFQDFCTRYSPYADMYYLGAQFALLKLLEAEQTDPTEVLEALSAKVAANMKAAQNSPYIQSSVYGSQSPLRQILRPIFG